MMSAECLLAAGRLDDVGRDAVSKYTQSFNSEWKLSVK